MAQLHHPTRTRPGVVVRDATAADVVTTARVWGAAWLDGHRGQVPDALLAARGPEYFTDKAAAMTDSTLLAIEPDGGIAGVAIIAGDELFQLAVDRTVRGRGVGAALLHTVERRVAAASYDRAWLAVVPGNTRARDFYERHGWRDDGPMTYAAPAAAGRVHVAVRRYVKDLSRLHGARPAGDIGRSADATAGPGH